MNNINHFALECKKFCAGRCFFALIYAVGAQFLLLTTYLLFVFFSVFHPIDWLYGTFSAIFSLRTWLCLTPLIGVVVLNVIVMGKVHLAENRYYSTRFSFIVNTFGRQVSLFGIHISIGFLTAWLYSRFLPRGYTYLYSKCHEGSEEYCLNERFTFIALNGIYTGIHYFVSKRLRIPTIVEGFPLIQQSRSSELRFKVTEILYQAVVKQTILPTLSYIAGCIVLGGIILSQVAEIFGLQLSSDYSVFDVYMMVYIFAISSQIISNITLMDFLMNTFLTEYVEFPIESPVTATGSKMCLTLVDALAAEKTPLVQVLAALDMSTLSAPSKIFRRKQVYALSIPGGHPYNWTALSQQCLVMINAFREEIKTSADKCRAGRQGGLTMSPHLIGANKHGSNASEMAQTILTRQHNETYGIRNLSSKHPNYDDHSNVAPKPDPIGEATELLGRRVVQCKKAFLSLPMINYFFGSDEANRLVFLLSTQAPTIEWIVEGLSALVEHSLLEDSYGVVQTDLAAIVRSLLQLQTSLEQVSVSFNVHATSRHRQQCLGLLGTVKRSLCKLATIFGEYLPDILSDPSEIHAMNSYAQLRQV